MTLIWATFQTGMFSYRAYGYAKDTPIRIDGVHILKACSQQRVTQKLETYCYERGVDYRLINCFNGQKSPDDWLLRESLTREERDEVYGLQLGLMLGAGAAANQPAIDEIESRAYSRLYGGWWF